LGHAGGGIISDHAARLRCCPATDVATVTLKPSPLTRNIDDARRQRNRAAEARKAGDWQTEVADATSCFEQLAFAFNEIGNRLGPTAQKSTHPSPKSVAPAGGCAFNGCSEIRRGDYVASALAYELGEPPGTWQRELHELFTHLRNPNVHGCLDASTTPVPHPAGPNPHPVHAAATTERATAYVELLEEIVRRLGSKLPG
jgi:hypothetical protein